MSSVEIREKEITEFKHIFNLFDKDNSGILTWRELGTIMRFLD